MKKYNLLIATTPMQIINGIEAINSFNLKDTILVLTFKPRTKNNEQLERVAQLYNWSQIIRVNKKLKKKKFNEYLKLIHALKKNEYNYVFFGNYTSVYRAIIANIKKEQLYLIDDGTATINIYKNILQKNKLNKFSIKNLRFTFLGLKTRVIDKVNIFTYFKLKKDTNFNIINNNLNYFKAQLIKTTKYEDNIIFLGQPLVDSKFITEDDFKFYINSIISMHKKKIIYIPHRFEKVNENLCQFSSENFKILEIDIPIELYFIYNKIYPLKVISFCTTASFTLDKLYPKLELEHIVIPKEKLLKKQKAFHENYKMLSNQTKSKALFLNTCSPK